MRIFLQEEDERLLVDRLAEIGVQVERETELLGFQGRDYYLCSPA